MSSLADVTLWISQVKKGDREALEKLWDRYFHRLIGLARRRSEGVRPAVADPEGMAVSAFASFWRGLKREQFPSLFDRNDLWNLLARIIVNKAIDGARSMRAIKRGEGREQGESAFGQPENSSLRSGLGQVLGQEPTPDVAAQMEEECRGLLDRLGDKDLRCIAQWAMEGYTNQEIAGKLGCALRSVERNRNLIRGIWEKEVGQ